eukprot:c5273_g1_i2.p1 GENE.c5273_g1_i2~~c5273_g1_i2.p1  ORF type:complete len:188 (-),score=22.73 c5273_g1_i2:22-585(-)
MESEADFDQELRKRKHSIVEHQRRLKMRTLIERLIDLLPSSFRSPDHCSGTVSALCSVLEYMNTLQQRLKTLGAVELVSAAANPTSFVPQMEVAPPQVFHPPSAPAPVPIPVPGSTAIDANTTQLMKTLVQAASLKDKSRLVLSADSQSLLESLSAAIKPRLTPTTEPDNQANIVVSEPTCTVPQQS